MDSLFHFSRWLTEKRMEGLTALIDILNVLFEILFRRQLDASGSTNSHAAVAEYKAFVRVCHNELGTLDSCWIRWARLEYTGLAEHLAVTATVTKIGVYGGIPWNILSWNKKPLFPLLSRLFRHRYR